MPLSYNQISGFIICDYVGTSKGKIQRCNMKKYGFLMLLLVFTALLCFTLIACGGKAKLDQEFTISIGQSFTIAEADLEITFVEVLADNRCARDVVCITAGEVVCLLKIDEGESSYNIELAQPGLYYDYSHDSFGGYRYVYKVEPYPESDKIISADEYFILLTVSK